MPRTLDLTEDAAFLRVLLSDTLAWRHRLVERFTFGSGEHVRVKAATSANFPMRCWSHFSPDTSFVTL